LKKVIASFFAEIRVTDWANHYRPFVLFK